MKKFLIFLVAIVVSVCVGVTAFYFLRNDEVISIEKTSIMINVGDFVATDGIAYNSIGLKSSEKRSRTKYDYRVEDLNGTNITDQNVFSYDKENDVYIAKKGGTYNLIITTNNKKYPSFKVRVQVGDGTYSNPFYIRNKSEFASIKDNKCYTMLNDVTLDKNFYLNCEFTGVLDGNNFAVKGLNIADTNTAEEIGLFKRISGGTVRNLVIDGAVISGTHNNMGALAGSIVGLANISHVSVKGAKLTNLNTNGNVGGLAASVNTANINLCSVDDTLINIGAVSEAEAVAEGEGTTVATPKVGGLVAVDNMASIKACMAKVTVSANTNIAYGSVGGLIGELTVSPASATDYSAVKGVVHQSYAVITGVAEAPAFIGKVDANAKIVETSLNTSNGVDGNTHTYAYFVGNYALNTANNSSSLVGSYTDNAKAIETRLNSAGVEGQTRKTFITLIGGANITYYYYNNIEWDSSVWDFTDMYPSLKADCSEKNISNVSSAYIASTIKVVVDDSNLTELPDIINGGSSNVEVVVDQALNLDFTTETPYKNWNKNLVFKTPAIIRVKNALCAGEFKGTLENATIIVEVLDTASDVYGAVASKLKAGSNLTNVNVEFGDQTAEKSTVINRNNIVTFGGLVGVAEAETEIRNCSVKNINISTGSNIATAGGLVGELNGKLTVEKGIADFVNFNSLAVANVGGIAGVVAGNGIIENGDFTANINIASAGNGTNVAGVAGRVGANSSVNNVKLAGAINYQTNMTVTDLSIAGLVANNSGKLTNAESNLDYIASKNGETYRYPDSSNYNYKVAGAVWHNEGRVNRVVIKTNLYGNYVAGIVGEQTEGEISEVLLTGANWSNKIKYVLDTAENGTKFSEGANTLSANKFVAGVAYSVSAGKITDVQTNSIINAGADSTKASNVVFIFESGATIKDAVINNKFDGNASAVYYRDTWMDMNNNATVGSNKGWNYNLYGIKGFSGTMQSVVINSENMRSSGVITSGNYRQSMFHEQFHYYLVYGYHDTTYKTDGNQNNYVREVNAADFAKADSFKGSFNLVANADNTTSNYKNYSFSKELTFSADKWSAADGSNMGIILNFVNV